VIEQAEQQQKAAKCDPGVYGGDRGGNENNSFLNFLHSSFRVLYVLWWTELLRRQVRGLNGSS
jgi:hypothetical protein